jgi:catalase
MTSPEQAIERINATFGRHPGYRALHAKGRFYAATFTATSEAAALCRAAHLQGGPVPAIVRLSDGSGHPRTIDRLPDVRGLAVSFRLPDGSATDLLAQTAPRFPVRSVEDFLALTYAAGQGRRKPWLVPAFMARHPATVPALLANIRAGSLKPPRSFAEPAYYPIHAYRWLDAGGAGTWVRYTWSGDVARDALPKPDRKDPDYLQNEFIDRLARGPVRFTLRVQVAAEGDDPHDPTSVWKGSRTFDAGTLEITAPDPDRETDGELIVFDPVRIVDGIELSDDPILRYRPLAYSVSADRRA